MKIIGRRTREIPDYFRWPISFLRTLVELREIANLGRYRFIRGRVTYTLFSLLTCRCVCIRQRTWSPSVRFRNAFIVSQKKTPERAKTCFDDGFFFFVLFYEPRAAQRTSNSFYRLWETGPYRRRAYICRHTTRWFHTAVVCCALVKWVGNIWKPVRKVFWTNLLYGY